MSIEYLEKLNEELWQSHQDYYNNRRRKWCSEKRKIQMKELQKVFKTIKKEKLGIKVHNACMGFGIGISIYAKPSFPGVKPEYIITITSDHLKPKRNSEKIRGFERGWELFSEFAKKNENLLLEPLRDKGYYDY